MVDMMCKEKLELEWRKMPSTREESYWRKQWTQKTKIIKAVVWSAASYRSDTWTMRENEIDRLEEFEKWIGEEWRRNIVKLGGKWTDIWDSEGKEDANGRNKK